ncbi:hypothetical protein [Legionella waltersii]|uniref:Uncharacterized protein n=1 Tax=Legionella waltersii TaxID=66969 RepID=A0A0W1A089_9GAMM|nr:hypothetical protein [Legionella waltersii]KTD74769.1 hypothetical protein Lwal_2810 [Legionella waltersii]SNV00352.1 Uncharacterised protein [Legionella waltersii]
MKRAHVSEGSKHSTLKIMLAVTDKAKEKLQQAIIELKGLKLAQEKRAIALLEQNPQSINRLLTLFKNVNKYDIQLNEEVYSYIEKNVDSVAKLSNVIELLSQTNIPPKSIPFKLLCNGSNGSDELSLSFNLFINKQQIDLPSIILLLSFPEQSLELASLIISLQNRAYSIEAIQPSLVAARKESASDVIELLTLVLKSGLFYPDFVNVVVAMGGGVKSVLEGAKRLASRDILNAGYFDIAKSNPENASMFAKHIELLVDSELIDMRNKRQLSQLSDCGVGVLCFLQQLKKAGKLNAEAFSIVIQHKAILNDKGIEKQFSELPLLTQFSGAEIDSILNWMQEKTSQNATESIIALIDSYQLERNESSQSSSL